MAKPKKKRNKKKSRGQPVVKETMTCPTPVQQWRDFEKHFKVDFPDLDEREAALCQESFLAGQESTFKLLEMFLDHGLTPQDTFITAQQFRELNLTSVIQLKERHKNNGEHGPERTTHS